jgi:uncharacterized protein (TIGR00297 family)
VTAYSETARQIVHVAMAGFALLLRVFTWPQAAALAGGALLFNLFLLRRVAPSIVRPAELRTRRAGILFYPLSILILVLVFRDRLDIVAAAWGLMAFGDGMATLAGTWRPGRALPWNPGKTWSGLLAFVVFGAPAAVGLSLWVAPAVPAAPEPMSLLWASLVATIVAALAETLPIGLDDNVTVPVTAAATIWFVGHLDWTPGLDDLARDLLVGMAVSAPLAVMTVRAQKITRGGAAAGVAIGAVIYAGAFLAGLAVLAVALAVTLASSRAGAMAGRPATHSERRGLGNILANCLVGALGAAAERLSVEWVPIATAVWLVAGIAAGASDTVASEIGKAFGGVARTFPTWRRAPEGTSGAVTVTGTIAGIAGSAVIAAPAAALWLIPWTAVPCIVLACTIAAFTESALSTAFEARGILDNDTLNFVNTAVAAGLAVALCAAV